MLTPCASPRQPGEKKIRCGPAMRVPLCGLVDFRTVGPENEISRR